MRIAHTGGTADRRHRRAAQLRAPAWFARSRRVSASSRSPTSCRPAPSPSPRATPTEGQTLTVTENVTDADGIAGPKELNWQYGRLRAPGRRSPREPAGGVLADLVVNRAIRVEVSFADDGGPEAFASAPVGSVAKSRRAAGVRRSGPRRSSRARRSPPMSAPSPTRTGTGPARHTRWQQRAANGGGTFTDIGGATAADPHARRCAGQPPDPGRGHLHRRVRNPRVGRLGSDPAGAVTCSSATARRTR